MDTNSIYELHTLRRTLKKMFVEKEIDALYYSSQVAKVEAAIEKKKEALGSSAGAPAAVPDNEDGLGAAAEEEGEEDDLVGEELARMDGDDYELLVEEDGRPFRDGESDKNDDHGPGIFGWDADEGMEEQEEEEEPVLEQNEAVEEASGGGGVIEVGAAVFVETIGTCVVKELDDGTHDGKLKVEYFRKLPNACVACFLIFFALPCNPPNQ